MLYLLFALIAPAVSVDQWVLGYYPAYSSPDLPIANIPWTGLTHIAFGVVTVKSDRSLELGFCGYGATLASQLSAAAHAHGVKPILMFGGADAGVNIAAAATAQYRSQLVTNLLSTMVSLGYDGIDLDWEDNVNLDDLVALAAALRAANSSVILTYPAGMINSNYQIVDAKFGQLAQSLDRFFVQTYYPSTAFAGQGWSSWFLSPLSGKSGTTPIAADDTLMRYENAGVPKAKLGIGMGWYAICYPTGITGPRQATSDGQSITGGDNNFPLSAFFAAGGTFATATAAQIQYDAVAKAPYLNFSSPKSESHCGGSTQYISYEDETSIAAKGNFSIAGGYGGVIIWTITEGWLPTNAVGGRSRDAIFQAVRTAFQLGTSGGTSAPTPKAPTPDLSTCNVTTLAAALTAANVCNCSVFITTSTVNTSACLTGLCDNYTLACEAATVSLRACVQAKSAASMIPSYVEFEAVAESCKTASGSSAIHPFLALLSLFAFFV